MVKPLLCATPYIVARRVSEARLIVKLLLKCDALHLTEVGCSAFLYERGIQKHAIQNLFASPERNAQQKIKSFYSFEYHINIITSVINHLSFMIRVYLITRQENRIFYNERISTMSVSPYIAMPPLKCTYTLMHFVSINILSKK